MLMRRADFKPKNLIRRFREQREYALLDGKPKLDRPLSWSSADPCDSPLYDAGSAQIGSLLYVFGGFVHLGEVSQKVRVFDVRNRAWRAPLKAPSDLPTSHCSIASDGKRYI